MVEVDLIEAEAAESLVQWVVLPRLPQLRVEMPKTVFTFRNLRGATVLEHLREAQIDFGLLAQRPMPAGIAAAKLGVMHYRMFVRAQSGESAKTLRWQEVIKRPFVGLEGGGRQVRAIVEIARRHGVELAPSVLCSSLPTVAAILGEHEGFAILPAAAGRAGLVAVGAPFLKDLDRPISLAWSERRIKTRDAVPRWRRILARVLGF